MNSRRREAYISCGKTEPAADRANHLNRTVILLRLPLLIAQAKLTSLIVETSGAALRLPPSAVTVASWGLTVAPARGRGIMAKPVLSKEELRAQLEAALANYHGPVTHCRPGAAAGA
jgi:hypothetical protein